MINHGLIERDYKIDPVGVDAPKFSGDVIQRKHWPDLIADQRKNFNSPYAVHVENNVPILDQTSFRYCWMFAIVAGVMNRAAFQGLNDPVDELSATAVASQGKNFRNVGGHCSEAVRYCQKFGIPNSDVWPNDQSSRRYARKKQVRESAAKQNIVQFADLGQDFDAAISCLLSPTPVPVSFSLPWWKHAVLGLQVNFLPRKNPLQIESYELVFVNSYGASYEQGGFGKLRGANMIGQEYIAIENVQVGNDDDR